MPYNERLTHPVAEATGNNWPLWRNALRPKQNGWHFAYAIFKFRKIDIFIRNVLMFAPNGPISNYQHSQQTSDEPLSEPMLGKFADTYILEFVSERFESLWVSQFNVRNRTIVGFITDHMHTPVSLGINWLNHWGQARWPPFATEVCSQGSSWQCSFIGSDNGLALARRHVIIWTNDSLFTDAYMRHSASMI